MAKEIEETTTDDAPEEAPRRRTTEEVEQAVLATLGRRPKRLISIIEESGVCRSSVCRILKALVEAGQASRHPGGAYSLPGGKTASLDDGDRAMIFDALEGHARRLAVTGQIERSQAVHGLLVRLGKGAD